MHEHSVVNGLVQQALDAAGGAGSSRVIRVKVSLGPWSTFTPEHLRTHFEHAALGTAAEGADLEVVPADAAGHAPSDRQLSTEFFLEEVEVE